MVLDLDSRRVVGWACGFALTTVLARAALLTAHGLVAGMSRTANRYDNAALESFDSTPRIECLHRHKLATRAQAPAVTFDDLETCYNRERIHSAPGYQSPVDFENQPNETIRVTRPALCAFPIQAHPIATPRGAGLGGGATRRMG